MKCPGTRALGGPRVGQGGNQGERRAALEEVVRETFLPNRVLVRWRESDEARIAKVIPAVEGKRTREGKPTAYVCERGICQAPTSDPSKLRAQLVEIKAYDGR